MWGLMKMNFNLFKNDGYFICSKMLSDIPKVGSDIRLTGLTSIKSFHVNRIIYPIVKNGNLTTTNISLFGDIKDIRKDD